MVQILAKFTTHSINITLIALGTMEILLKWIFKIMNSPGNNKREKSINENNGNNSFLPSIRQKITITQGNDYGSQNVHK